MEKVIIRNLSKSFRIKSRKQQTMLARVVGMFSGRESQQTLQALDDVSFSVGRGEIFGILGRNGSGKSTLLKIIAGIVRHDSGSVHTEGRVLAITHLSAGIKDRLTMRENTFLLCTLLGLNVSEIKDRFDSITTYADLENFVHTKLYQFSDGMKQRLLIAIAFHVPFDILLLDEAFAVGDERFRQKSLAYIHDCAKAGATIVVAGHYFPLIDEHCDRVMWLESGEVKMIGAAHEVVSRYVTHERQSVS